jgi:hypothetical protein
MVSMLEAIATHSSKMWCRSVWICAFVSATLLRMVMDSSPATGSRHQRRRAPVRRRERVIILAARLMELG